MPSRCFQSAVCSSLLLVSSTAWSQAQGADGAAEPNGDRTTLTVTVVGVSPAPGSAIPIDEYAGSVQRIRRGEIERTRESGVTGVLSQRAAGVTLSNPQGSTLQPDVNYRGFTSSSLIGTPQGFAAYQSGVRINDAFADTLDWDLIPTFAIDQIDLLSGMNAVYGLNALGGALVLQMKNGFTFSGTRASASAGSFGRYTGLLESGVQQDGWAAYAGGDVFRERGFRDHSPSAARRFYGDLRHRAENRELALTISAGDTKLFGNGPAPLSLLDRDRHSIFTYPDSTHNSQATIGAEGRARVAPGSWLRASAYFRRGIRRTLNGDEAELEGCADQPSVLCDEDGERVTTEAGGPVTVGAGGSGVVNSTRTAALSIGSAVQGTFEQPVLRRPNHLILGGTVDVASIDFSQRSELGELQADRQVAGNGLFLGGEGRRTLLAVRNRYLGAFVSDTYSVTDRLHVTASGRVNWLKLTLADQLGDELAGDHTYVRLNPALGASFILARGSNVYASYSESNRAPSAVELACANPDQPCRVPNAFLSDPALSQVVTRQVELGSRIRAPLSDTLTIEGAFAAFGSRNADDILFVAGSRFGTGYFRNAGVTQRAGFDVGGTLRAGRVSAYVLYQFVRATFESDLLLPGAHHPTATFDDSGARVIAVRPGDRLPTTPMHSLKIGGSVSPIPGLLLGSSVHVTSSQYYRGDEINALGPVPGYAVAAANASYRVARFATAFLQAENVLNTRYETFGLLGNASNVLPGVSDPRFASPGAPFGIWAGLELRLLPDS